MQLTAYVSSKAARHICQEAGVVLCSLRGGPPSVARGELTHDLQDLRVHVRAYYQEKSSKFPAEEKNDERERDRRHKFTYSASICSKFMEGPHPPLPLSSDRKDRIGSSPESISLHDVGPFVRPFLAVIIDPRAAGPHTLVALRSLFRLISNNSFCDFPLALEPLMKGVLQCKFEQTDTGADEAVEMAIADLLSLLVTLDSCAPETLMDTFNTVFVTRNTFVHSPALCYHFEVVLVTLVDTVFQRKDCSAKLILEFLVNQLLHTPFSSGPTIDEASREAQIAHDATRVICLKLTRRCLIVGCDNEDITQDEDILHIIQDDLCLSLLMTGQAIWAKSPGYIPLDILSEICATISTIWNIAQLRAFLIPQFESIFTGFYQRGLMLLRQRPNPVDSTSFNENFSFDAELELILESLVDVLCLQDQRKHQSPSTLESLFTTYDCDLRRSDVAEHLLVELARCCGAVISDGGVTTIEAFEIVDNQRPVPPHLKELCAEALLGCLKSLCPTSEMTQYANIYICGSHTVTKGSHVDCDDGAKNSLGEKCSSYASEDGRDISHREVKLRKTQFRKAAKLFNEKASKGIDFLVKSELIRETPQDVASFLRNGLVLGLNKEVVGQYLGELGKAPSAGKSPPCWERDWFHKEVLTEYCGLFRFENQSLLDGLRMFLASFRLPGEGQQIDRIVQAFADSCGRRCDEAIQMKLFSNDPKRASDTAFLLAYSIIMLNTDQHNPHVREDKKMSIEAFVKNNSDYGRDITEKGKELPRAFLEGIYHSIREEEIRTEAEGAEGHMTVERWKDVLRGSTVSLSIGEPKSNILDLKELVIDTVWTLIASTVSALWGVIRPHQRPIIGTTDVIQSGMLGAQGARLGMDLALGLMTAIRNIGRNETFQLFFSSVCGYSGLLGEYKSDAVERTSNFVQSVEAQSAVIVSIRTAQEAANDLGMEGWMRIWFIIFELRDLKLLMGGPSQKRRSLLAESDDDLLHSNSRREWIMKMAKGSFGDASNHISQESPQSFFGFLFGSESDHQRKKDITESRTVEPEISIHGKDELLLWNELAMSDTEGDTEDDNCNGGDDAELGYEFQMREKIDISNFSSAGAQFESQLIHEDILIYQQKDTPITGLERVEETSTHHLSPRARVRQRLARACDFPGLVLESRFMEINGVILLLQSLARIIKISMESKRSKFEKFANTGNNREECALSPASEALAEVLLCEISLKNKDRLGSLWKTVLKGHYSECFQCLAKVDTEQRGIALFEPGVEKRVTGMLRLCSCALQRGDIANEMLLSLSLLTQRETPREIADLDKHISEGIWRICSNLDGLIMLDKKGWTALLSLIQWCAARAATSSSNGREERRIVGMTEDDPAVKVYRSLHLMLHARELKTLIPVTITKSIVTLVHATDEAGCSKLSLASVDLLHLLQSNFQIKICNSLATNGIADNLIVSNWQEILDGISYTLKTSINSVVRSHALSILIDAFLDKQGSSLPPSVLCTVLPPICIRTSIERIAELLQDESNMLENTEDTMIEFEQCISLIFKPFLHHVKNIINANLPSGLEIVWEQLLLAMAELLQRRPDENQEPDENIITAGILRKTLKELATEHFRNALMVLHAHGVLDSNPAETDSLSRDTWLIIDRMTFCSQLSEQWQASMSPPEE